MKKELVKTLHAAHLGRRLVGLHLKNSYSYLIKEKFLSKKVISISSNTHSTDWYVGQIGQIEHFPYMHN
jgi:hypothetical protein